VLSLVHAQVRSCRQGDKASLRIAIVTAVAELLREGGPRAVTTRAVSERAGIQAPTIYRLFGDKDGLIEAVAESIMDSYVSAKQPAPAESVSPVEVLHAAWQCHVDFGLQNPGLYAMIAGPGRRDPSPATLAGIEVLRGLIGTMAAAGHLIVSERRALQMVHSAGNGAVLALLDENPNTRDLGLTDAMFDATMAAITGSSHSGTDRATNTLATAVQFGTVIQDLPGLSATERELLAEWVTRSVTSMENPSPVLPAAARLH